MLAVGAASAAVLIGGVGAYAAYDATTTDATATPATSSTSQDGLSDDTHAIVVNHGDDRYRYAIALRIVQVNDDVADPQNVAVAVAGDCTGCQTVAISMEGVLVYGDPDVFAPTNLALAYNENCSNCATLAEAYQAIVPTSGRVRITGTGRQIIASVRQDLEMIRHQDLSLTEIDARVDADAAKLLDVLRNEVVPVGRPATASVTPEPATVSSSASPSPSASPADSASPTESATPTETATPSDTATASPSDSATAGAAG